MTVMAAALVYAMVAWINTTGMIEPAWPTEQLQLHVTSRDVFARDIQRCFVVKGFEPPPYEIALEQAGHMKGMYCKDRITLDGARVDLEHPAGQAALVHELVHWIQDYNGDAEAAECLRATEYDAYAIHREWQKQMGLTQTPDEFTVIMRSECPRAQ